MQFKARGLFSLLAIACIALAAAGSAQAQTLSASPSNLYTSQSVTAAWGGIATPTSTDWVGLYAVGAADTAILAWQYTNGSASGNAAIQVPNTTSAGSYELRLFANNGYTKLATSSGITVQTPPAANLTAGPASLYASQTVTGSYSTIFSPTATDWVGLYAVGSADTAIIAWQYTNGTASGSVPIAVPNATAAGSYELRLFSNNGYTKLATSNGVTVQTPPAASLTAAPASLYASQSVTGTYSTIFSPTATDWVGLYAVGTADTAIIAWQFTNGSASGSVAIQVPNATAAGAYELRLFSNNGYTKLATSNGFTVNAPPAATLTVTGSASPGGSVTATWASILAPTANDWIGLYAPASADTAIIAWRYTTGVAAGNLPLSLPATLAPGTYELRLFANNGYTRLATSATFSVGVLKLSFIHVDHLNTPRAVYDDQQQLRWRWDQQEPFGADTPNGDPVNAGVVFDLPLRLPGQYLDRETGIYQNGFREFDPSLGIYKQSDPIGLRAGLNTYAYVGSSSLNYSDPLGLKTYQCKKPLNALTNKFGAGVSNFAKDYVPAAYHQYSCVLDKNGKITCGGQDHSGSPLRSPGKPTVDSKDAGQCKLTQPDNDCFEQCLKREWEKPRPMYGIPFGMDCQEYDDEVNQRCRTQCNVK